MKAANSILIIFLVGTILSPVLVESGHSWTHIRQLNPCNETTTNHIHSVQHTCFACDLFIALVHFVPPVEHFFDPSNFIPYPAFSNSFLYIDIDHPDHFLRGPPALI